MISVVTEMPHMYIYFTGFVNISIVTRQEKIKYCLPIQEKQKSNPKYILINVLIYGMNTITHTLKNVIY